MEPGVHPRRHSGPRSARHEPQKAKRSTDYVGGPSRKIEVKFADKVASPFSAKLDRLSEHLQMKDLTAAARELKGEVVKRKANGVPWDHVHEVRDAQNGLLKAIADINKKLAHPKTGGAERDLLVADLGRASRMLDFPERYVPRG
ncbi:polymorphic toxin type 28 domain-containing protein [Streptomyces sp. NPDC018972]|uniref:polymorphic toxin type 28 domain-containing protein n=1 Tax=Streptomyces sp. NPDC018972 TaxID=3365060 RepID=UPI00378E71B6